MYISQRMPLNAAIVLSSMFFCGQSAALSPIRMCNDTSFDVSFSFLYDQTADAPQHRRGKDRYRAGGWLYINKGRCDEGIPLENGQMIYIAFSKRSYDGGGSVVLSASGLPHRGRKKVNYICADLTRAFDISSSSLSKMTERCSAGFKPMRVSFGLRGGTGAHTIRLTK